MNLLKRNDQDLTNRVKWITHNGKDILLIDYSNSDGKGMREVIQDVREAYKHVEEHSVLGLGNFSNVFATDGIIEDFKVLTRDSVPFDKRNAVVGLSRGQRVGLRIVKLFSKNKNAAMPFNTREEALAYLTK